MGEGVQTFVVKILQNKFCSFHFVLVNFIKIVRNMAYGMRGLKEQNTGYESHKVAKSKANVHFLRSLKNNSTRSIRVIVIYSAIEHGVRE